MEYNLICETCGEIITGEIHSAGYWDSLGNFSYWNDDKIYCSEFCASRDSLSYDNNFEKTY